VTADRPTEHDLDVKSRVHPKYTTKYRVGSWPAYDRALIQRGDVTLWLAPEAIARWETAGVGTRGGQLQYSDVAIDTALTLRLLFHLPLRQTEGFLRSIFGMLGLDLSAPDHTTLSRRAQRLTLTLRRVPTGTGIHLIVDSTGLSIVGEGEWAAVKHGRRGTRGWKKLHLGVDGTGVIVAHALTGGHVDDATTALDLIDTVAGDVSCLTADAAYLRHAEYLRGGGCTWRDGRHSTDPNGHAVWTATTIACAPPHDPAGAAGRTSTVEEGLGLPSASPGGERLLPLQVDHWGASSSAQSRGARD